MVYRLARGAFAGALVASSACSFALDFDGYGVAADAGLERSRDVEFGPAVANFDAFHFARGRRTFAVPARDGVLANDGAGARLRAGSRPTRGGGSVQLAADGSFNYSPPGTTATFWGDDYFEYELLAEPSSSARVRLTVEPPALTLAELFASGGAGFGIAGARAQDFVGNGGASFAPAGDVNGDGLEDFVLGVRGPLFRDGFGNLLGPGRGAYVLFGKPDARNVSLADDSVDRAPGFAIVGDGDETRLTGFGVSVAGAGDVNGDGLSDVIVASPRAETGVALGAAYVVFGKRDAAPVSSREVLAGNGGGFAVMASTAGYQLVGSAVDGAGDVNGDGLDDVVVGVPIFDAANGGEAGGAFVVFGKVSPAPVSVDAIVAGSADGFAIFGATTSAFLGLDVAGVGDVNGDGLSDVAACASASPEGSNLGHYIVVLGQRGTSPARAADIEASGTGGYSIVGAEPSDGVGNISPGGDVNGDGFDDIVIGAPDARVGGSLSVTEPTTDNADAGEVADAGTPGESSGPTVTPGEQPGVVYVAFGSREPQSFGLQNLETAGSTGFAIGASDAGRVLGFATSSGDVDGDGLSDIVTALVTRSGDVRSFVVFGKRNTEPVVLPPAAMGASGVLTIICSTVEVGCRAFATGSDANGDGLDDLLLGSLYYPEAPQAAGGAYLAFGWDMNRALEGRDAVLLGSAADNVLDLPAAPIVIARGGRGTDTLRAGSGVRVIDLTLQGRFESIEIIDVRGNGAQRVILDEAGLRRLPQNHSGFAFGMARKLSVLGDAEDTLVFDLAGFSSRGANGGRSVYGRDGAYYGIEISQELRVQP